MNISGVHEYLGIIWPRPEQKNVFDQEVTKLEKKHGQWARARRRLQDMSGLFVFGFDSATDTQANQVQNDLIFLAAIAAVREVIG